MKLVRPSRSLEATVYCLDFASAPTFEALDTKPLCEIEIERILKFKSTQARDAFTICRLALRRIVGEILEEPPHSLIVTNSPLGKPFIRNEIGLEFNISHSASHAAIAITTDAPIGIDIEPRESFASSEHIWKLVCSDLEIQSLKSEVSKYEAAHAFAQMWTAKEAISKAVGYGQNLEFRSIETSPLSANGLPIRSSIRIAEKHFEVCTARIEAAYHHAGAISIVSSFNSIKSKLIDFDCGTL